MKKMMVISILGLILAFNLMAQVPGDTLWTRTYGGAEEDLGRSVQQTTDGGFIIAGSTNSFGAGDEDLWVIKTNANGDTLWTRKYGGIEEDQGNSIKQTSDGGYVVVGSTESFGAGDNDVYLIKTNSDGDTLWTKTYGDLNNESGIDIQLTSDGGYIILGSKSSVTPPTQWEIYVIKTDSYGDTLWTNTYGGDGLYWAVHIEQTNDGGYIISGSEDMSFGMPNIYVIKTDSVGNTIWTRLYGTHGVTMGEGYFIKPLADGYILGGHIFDSENPSLMAQANLIRIDSLGDTLWTKRYGDNGYEIFTSVQKTNDGGFCLTGVSNSHTPGAAGPHDVYIVRTDSIGDTLWTRTYGGDNWEWGTSIDLVQEGGYIITGYTDSFGAGDKDIWLLRIADEFIPSLNPPQNLFVDELGYATWDEPVSRELLGYNVYLDSVFVEYTTDLFYQYEDLINEQTYLAGVSAVYDEGESEIVELEFTFVLNPPQNLGIVCLEDHAHFTWEAPIADMRDSKRNTKTRKENTRDLTGYNVYLDQVEVATNIPDLEYDFYDLINGEYYDAGVKAIYDEGTSEIVEINFPYTGTGVENILPLITELTGNYPNPFNPETTISFSTTESSENTELVIYNLKGQKVKTLFNEKLPAGNHQIVWDGKDENGKPVSSGIYFYKMNTKDYTSTKRMILMK